MQMDLNFSIGLVKDEDPTIEQYSNMEAFKPNHLNVHCNEHHLKVRLQKRVNSAYLMKQKPFWYEFESNFSVVNLVELLKLKMAP
jgi:hypothetical protein